MVKKMYRWKRMPMYIDEWIEFKWRNLVWLKFFSNTKKLKNSNKKIKKLQKLINEVQKKTTQDRKKQIVYFMPESIEYATWLDNNLSLLRLQNAVENAFLSF